MADVKSHNCFPTVISQFSLDIEHAPMMERILLSAYRSTRPVVGIYRQRPGRKTDRETDEEDDHQKRNLQEDEVFKPLMSGILEATVSVLEKQQYQYDKIEITNMWANTLNSGESQPPHTHSNNFLSGVYYLQAGNTSPIQFFDPRPAAHTLQPRNTPNIINSSMVQFDSVEGIGFIFPAWLSHWVPPTKEQRISIAWNILLRGEYGEHGTLQNAHI